MELVAFLQRPAESLGEGCCDRRLPASRDAYDNEDCVRVKGSHECNVSRHAPFDHKMPCLGAKQSTCHQSRCPGPRHQNVPVEACIFSVGRFVFFSPAKSAGASDRKRPQPVASIYALLRQCIAAPSVCSVAAPCEMVAELPSNRMISSAI